VTSRQIAPLGPGAPRMPEEDAREQACFVPPRAPEGGAGRQVSPSRHCLRRSPALTRSPDPPQVGPQAPCDWSAGAQRSRRPLSAFHLRAMDGIGDDDGSDHPEKGLKGVGGRAHCWRVASHTGSSTGRPEGRLGIGASTRPTVPGPPSVAVRIQASRTGLSI